MALRTTLNAAAPDTQESDRDVRIVPRGLWTLNDDTWTREDLGRWRITTETVTKTWWAATAAACAALASSYTPASGYEYSASTTCQSEVLQAYQITIKEQKTTRTYEAPNG